MKKITILLFFLNSTLNLFGQDDWQLFVPHQIVWWQQGEDLQLHYVDSIAVNGDVKQYFFGVNYIKDEFGNCYEEVKNQVNSLNMYNLPLVYRQIREIVTMYVQSDY